MLPPLLEVKEIHKRLQEVFPSGIPQRNYVTREMAARTVFVMLYVGAIEGTGTWMAPKHLYRIGTRQSKRRTDRQRSSYANDVLKPAFKAPPDRWFQDNTREPIRDETLRDGLIRLGAVVTRPGIATTSPKGRYALQSAFASLFDPTLRHEPLASAISAWQAENLSLGALARVRLQHQSSAAAKSKVLVTFPSGESRQMAAGPSSVITKAVVEVFAPRFLANPAVLWISESGNKVVQRDDALAREIGVIVDIGKLLPDAILVDLGPKEPLIVFVEVVATDGAITESRRTALLELTTDAGYQERHVAFVSAFADRNSAAFKRAIPDLAWGSFAWCLSEPEHVIAFDGTVPGGVKLLTAIHTGNL
jgi:hypothetical protein